MKWASNFQPEKEPEARALLEKAYAKNSSELRYALGLSQALFVEGQYQRILDILAPGGKRRRPTWFLYFLGKSAHSLGRWMKPSPLHRLPFPVLGSTWNSSTSWHGALSKGNFTEALKAWKRSLEINSARRTSRNSSGRSKKKNKSTTGRSHRDQEKRRRLHRLAQPEVLDNPAGETDSCRPATLHRAQRPEQKRGAQQDASPLSRHNKQDSLTGLLTSLGLW